MVLGPVLVWVVGYGWSDESWLVVLWGCVVRLERFQCGFLIGEQWELGLGEIGGGIFASWLWLMFRWWLCNATWAERQTNYRQLWMIQLDQITDKP